MKYDVIIIGSGLGGLTAGAKIAKEGGKVLIIEQHDKVGGCATTFKRKDFVFEVGLHEMDGFHRTDMKTKIFNNLGVFKNVDFVEVPEFYRFVNEHYQITIPHEAEKAIEVLIKNFPKEEKGIKIYFEQILNAREKAKETENEPERTIGEFLDSIIEDENLKLVLLGNIGYYHDNPYTLSLTYYSAAQGSYFSRGGVFIKGGSQKLSDYLASIITNKGGKIIKNHSVTEIIIENNKAIGVKYKSVRKNNSDIISVFGNAVIANAAIPNVANTLLPKKYGNKLNEQISKHEAGASLLTVYLGLKKPLTTLGHKFYSTFFYNKTIETQKDIIKNNNSDFNTRSFTFIDYGRLKSNLSPEDKNVAVICCMDYLSDWENLSKEEYNVKKEATAQTFLKRLEEYIPGVKNLVEYYEIGTAKTVNRYILTPNGAVYGFAQSPERARADKIKSVDNLHFASAWTRIGGGFSGSIISGYLCAFDVLRKMKLF